MRCGGKCSWNDILSVLEVTKLASTSPKAILIRLKTLSQNLFLKVLTILKVVNILKVLTIRTHLMSLKMATI